MLNEEMLLFALNDMDDTLLERVRRTLGYKLVGRKRKVRKAVRIVLLAAVISTLMIGAAWAAGLIGVGNMRAGELFGVDMLSMEGLSDSAEGQALREWLSYYDEHREDPYDAEEAIALMDEYGPYGATTQAMADEIDRICGKYNLNRLGTLYTPPDEKSFYKAAGVGKLTAGNEQFENDYGGGYVYSSGTFQYDGTLFPRDKAYSIPYQFRKAVKGVLGYVTINAGDPNDYTEWQHKTADGQTLTISDSAHGAFFLLDREDSFVVVSIAESGWEDSFNDGILDGLGDKRVTFELSREGLEAIADSFNWAALDDPDLGMDGEFTYHQYSETNAVEQLTNKDIDLSMLPESQEWLKPSISAVYEQQIAPYIRDFRLVDYCIEKGRTDIGWISFTGTPVKSLNWRTVPSDKGEVYCRSVCVTTDDNGLPAALDSFDMLPIPKLDMARNIGAEENPDWIWLANEKKAIASATLYVQQTGKSYTVSDQAAVDALSLMLKKDNTISWDADDCRFNPLYLTYTDGSRALVFTAASGANAFWQYGQWQGYQYGRTIFDLFGIPLEAKGYTRHDGILTAHMESPDQQLLKWIEMDFAVDGDLLERRIMSEQLRQMRFEYDEDHHCVRETWWDGGAMTNEIVSNYAEDGRILHSETHTGNMWSITDYEYDAEGRLTAEVHRDNDDPPGFTGGNIYYSYDADGNCRRKMGWEQ